MLITLNRRFACATLLVINLTLSVLNLVTAGETMFGLPRSFRKSDIDLPFDLETTLDELRLRQVNPIAFAINPHIRSSIASLLRLERRYQQQRPSILKFLLGLFLHFFTL